MSVPIRLRDAIRDWVPRWLADRVGKSVGFRFFYAIASVLDVGVEASVQGTKAAWPGLGPDDALPLIGRSRGIVQGVTESKPHYALRLRGWLEAWADDRSEGLARQLHEYLPGNPRVRVVSRAGRWVTVNADGSVVRHTQAWDWDSISHPSRAGYWSDEWVIIYSAYALRPGTLGGLTVDDYTIGLLQPQAEVALTKAIIADWKGAHAKVRAVIWTTDAALFDPTSPGTLPDGQWGAWGGVGSGSRGRSHRNYTSCRYYEPWERDP